MLDHEKQIYDYEHTLLQLKKQNNENQLWTPKEMVAFEQKLKKLKEQVYAQLSPWERVTICRHPQRPRAVDYLQHLFEKSTEISGDRCYGDDHSIIAGMGTIGGHKVVIVAQEKGCDTNSRLYRNFGMPHPEGYRKALRAMKLAAKFDLPIISMIDTPGAYPGLSAEERGQGWAIARNLREMFRLSTPIIVVLIGEGCSGGALGIGVGDTIGMLEHSYYSVISPEGCASILWRNGERHAEAAGMLKIQAEDLLRFGIIDQIIKEPEGGAHHAPQVVYDHVKSFILDQLKLFSSIPADKLLSMRYQKFRKIGAFTRVVK